MTTARIESMIEHPGNKRAWFPGFFFVLEVLRLAVSSLWLQNHSVRAIEISGTCTLKYGWRVSYLGGRIMAGFWDSESILADIAKGRERIRVREVRRRNATMIDIRVFWQDRNNQWQPSKRGLSIPLESVGALADVLGKVSANAPAS